MYGVARRDNYRRFSVPSVFRSYFLRSYMVTRRLNRIFKPDGRALVVACDHGMISGPDQGIENMERTLAQVIAGGVDGVMASYGTATRFAAKLAQVGLVLRMYGAGTVLGPNAGPGRPVLHRGRTPCAWAPTPVRDRLPAPPRRTDPEVWPGIRQAHAWGCR